MASTTFTNARIGSGTMGTIGKRIHPTARREDDVFGYNTPPDIDKPHRDVLRWVQSLDLSHSLRNVRRDTANGFLVAEIFSRYYPEQIEMHSFMDASGSHYKKDNFEQLQRFCRRQGFEMPVDLVEGTIQGVHGAAVALLEVLYEHFTQKTLQRPPELPEEAKALAGGPSKDRFGSKRPGEEDGMPGQHRVTRNPRAGMAVGFGEVSQKVVDDAANLRKKFTGQGM